MAMPNAGGAVGGGIRAEASESQTSEKGTKLFQKTRPEFIQTNRTWSMRCLPGNGQVPPIRHPIPQAYR